MNVAMIAGGAGGAAGFKLVSSNQQRVVPVPTTLSLSSPYSRVGFKLVSSGNQQRVVPTTLSLSLSPYSRVADHAAGDHARRRVVSMASSSSSSSGGGGSGLLDRPLTPKKDTVRKRPPIYKVLLHNDDYNKREYVVQVLLKHVEGYTVEDALNVMREAHIYGVALVVECSQDKAESTCEAIRLSGLISTIEPR